jgi:membrane-associated PAP2 superfamily phosphatase
MHNLANGTADSRTNLSSVRPAQASSATSSHHFAIRVLGYPLLLLLAATLVLWVTTWDIAIAGLFYDAASETWPWYQAEPWVTLYHYGPSPGLILGLAAAATTVLSFFWKRLHSWREMGLFLALLLALGPGLAVNGIFKPIWMRPRPQQIRDFGGEQAFVKAWDFGSHGTSKSFPCGHASMGFYLMGPAFLLYRRQRKWAAFFLCLGLSWGGILGLARMAQGQHFLSDVIWSGGMVYITGLVLSYLFHLNQNWRSRSAAEPTQPVIISLGEASQDETSSREADDVGRRHAA